MAARGTGLDCIVIAKVINVAARGRGLDYIVIAKVGPTVAARGVTLLYYCQSTVAPRGRVSGSIIWYPVHRYDNHICKSLLTPWTEAVTL